MGRGANKEETSDLILDHHEDWARAGSTSAHMATNAASTEGEDLILNGGMNAKGYVTCGHGVVDVAGSINVRKGRKLQDCRRKLQDCSRKRS